MRQESESERYLLDTVQRVLTHRRIVRAPGLVERWAECREEERDDPWSRDREHSENRPSERRTRKERPARDQEREHRDLHGAAPQIVEDLPAREDRQPIGFRPVRPRYARRQPLEELPVAADPAVLAPRERQISRRVLVEYRDVGGQPGAREAPFDQVVREEPVLGEASSRRALECGHVVDPLSGEAPLVIEILVHVGNGGGVRIDAGVPGVYDGETRSVCAREPHSHPGLKNRVAARDSPHLRIVPCAIERVCHGTRQLGSGVRREHGIRVERDHVARSAERVAILRDHGKRIVAHAFDEVVELRELPSLALPTHPYTLPRVPPPGTVEEEEDRVAGNRVALVEYLHALDGRAHDRVVILAVLGGRVGEISEDRVLQSCIAVGEELDFEVLQRVAHRSRAPEQSRHHHGGSKFVRHSTLREVELRERARWHERRDEPAHHAHRDVVRRYESQQEHRQPCGKRGRPREPEHGHQRHDRARRDPAHEQHVGVAEYPATKPLLQIGLVVRGFLQRRAPLVDQVVAYVRAPRVARVALAGAVRGGRGPARGDVRAREFHRLERDVLFSHSRAFCDPLDHVPIAIARGEVHPGVVTRRVVTQDRLHAAATLDERAPVHPPDRAQTRDAVGHHELRERQPLGRACDRILRRHPLLVDPLLEPDQGRERSRTEAKLMEEARYEIGVEVVLRADELAECGAERGTTGIVRRLQSGGPPVGTLDLVESLHGTERHPPYVLDQAEAQHCRDGPQLSDRKRRDLLKCSDE